MNTGINIFFLKGSKSNSNTASYNRFLMLKQMCDEYGSIYAGDFILEKFRIINKSWLKKAVV